MNLTKIDDVCSRSVQVIHWRSVGTGSANAAGRFSQPHRSCLLHQISSNDQSWQTGAPVSKCRHAPSVVVAPVKAQRSQLAKVAHVRLIPLAQRTVDRSEEHTSEL